MRIKSHIWVSAYMRRVMSEGVAAYIVSHGDDFAGAVFIHIDNLQHEHWLYGPAPAGLEQVVSERRWISCFKQAPVGPEQVTDYLQRQKTYDPDLWIVELEDRLGRHFLDDQLLELEG